MCVVRASSSVPDEPARVHTSNATRTRIPKLSGVTTPLWLTILLAVSTPTLTLGGVLWTQYRADKRSEREAELRVSERRDKDREDRLFVTYSDLLVAANEFVYRVMQWPYDDADYNACRDKIVRAHLMAKAVGSSEVALAATRLMSACRGLNDANSLGRKNRYELANAATTSVKTLQAAIRHELSPPQSPAPADGQ